jgi:arsenate reductase
MMKTILFICTGNSARSVMAEVLMNELGEGRYQAFSAGAQPSGEVNPLTIETLNAHGHSTDGLRSKSLTEFLDKDIDIVVTVCDNARGRPPSCIGASTTRRCSREPARRSWLSSRRFTGR